MGEKTKTDDKNIFSISVSDMLLKEIDSARAKEDYRISRNSFINGLIRKALKVDDETSYLD